MADNRLDPNWESFVKLSKEASQMRATLDHSLTQLVEDFRCGRVAGDEFIKRRDVHFSLAETVREAEAKALRVFRKLS